MTAKQLRELEDYYSIEPFGEIREELRHGQKMALECNINRDLKSKAYNASDFMNFVEVPEPETPVETPEIISSRIASELFKLR